MKETKSTESKTGVSRMGKQGGYSSVVLKAKRAAKRKDAETRDAEHDSLTTKEKIQKASSRRGNSLTELARLKEQLLKENLAATPETAKAVKGPKVPKH